MFVVAVAELPGGVEAAALALGPIAGLAAFDVRARLIGPLPRVLYQSQDAEEARRVLLAARALGFGVLGCDTRAVVPSQRMVHARRFVFDETRFWADEGREHLAFADIAAVIACASRTDVIRTTREQEMVQISAKNIPHSTSVEHTRHDHAVEYAAYLFPAAPADGGAATTPLLLREQELKYVSLGSALRPTRRENFMLTLELVRARTRAVYDDRFLAHPAMAAHVARARDHDAAITGPGDFNLDLTAHMLAAWLTHPHGSPYRR